MVLFCGTRYVTNKGYEFEDKKLSFAGNGPERLNLAEVERAEDSDLSKSYSSRSCSKVYVDKFVLGLRI